MQVNCDKKHQKLRGPKWILLEIGGHGPPAPGSAATGVCLYLCVCVYVCLCVCLCDRYIKQYGWAVASAAHTCTVYVTVLVAVHRYVYVCCSHNTKRLSTLRRAKVHVAVVPLFALCYSLPRVLEYRVVHPTSPNSTAAAGNLSADPDSVVGLLEFTETGSSFWFQIVYKNVCFYVVMYVVPLSTLVVVTVRLLATMRRRRRTAAVHGGRQQARDDSVTVVLVIVIVVFIVCQTPTLLQRLMLALTGIRALDCGRSYYYVEKLADYLAVFNSCVNFGIYVVFAPHFRRILVADVLGLGRRSRRRRSRGEADRHRTTACRGGGARGLMTSCGGGTRTPAADASVDTVSCRGAGSRGWSEDDRTGGADCSSERAECFAASSPTQSSAKQQHPGLPQKTRPDDDDVLLNGVSNTLPLKPLLSGSDQQE